MHLTKIYDLALLLHPFRTNRTPISKWTVLLSGKILHNLEQQWNLTPKLLRCWSRWVSAGLGALDLIELSSFCNFRKGAKFESRKENKSGDGISQWRNCNFETYGGSKQLVFKVQSEKKAASVTTSHYSWDSLFERVYPFRHQWL